MFDQKIINQILSKHSNLTRERLLNEIEAEKQKTGYLIEESTLFRLIGARYGIENNQNMPFNGMLTISDLISGLYNISIKGRLVAIFPIKSFQRVNSGKLLRLIISDKTAMIRVILWNEKTELIKIQKIGIGDVILISEGYTREDHRGKVELHIGKKGEIKKINSETEPEDYPSIQKFSNKIIEVTPQLTEVTVIGNVKEIHPIHRFIRSDLTKGALLRFIISDETGEIPVLVWDEQAEKTDVLLKKNRKLNLINVKVNQNTNNSLELQVTSNTYLHFL